MNKLFLKILTLEPNKISLIDPKYHRYKQTEALKVQHQVGKQTF